MNRLRVPRVPVRELPSTLGALLLAVPVEVGLRLTTLPRLARIMATPLTQPDDQQLPTPGSLHRCRPGRSDACVRRNGC